jgi:predicted ATPase
LKIKKLHIKNFKSIADLEIIEPNPFTVFVGPNGSGKSNIFEALEFWNINQRFSDSSVADFFGGEMSFMNSPHKDLNFRVDFESNYFEMKKYISDDVPHSLQKKYFTFGINRFNQLEDFANNYHPNFEQFFRYFSRLFISKKDMQKLNNDGSDSLNFSSENLEKVLGRILKDKFKREELLEWSSLFIPEFEDVFIESNRNKDTLIVREKFSDKDFTKDLLSDGTYNILALLTAVLQSHDGEPQFLCIEEVENGLNPKVVRELVGFFRYACEEKGHYIWVNTHSQTLLAELKEEELIIVDKKKGETQIKQFKKGDFYGLRADEALLTNVLGGGIPW